MDLRIHPQHVEGEEPVPDKVYRLTLDGYPIHDILNSTEWHSPAIIAAARFIESGAAGSAREKFEYYKAHPGKLPRGITLRTQLDSD